MSLNDVIGALEAHLEGRLEDFERIVKEMFDEMGANKNGEVDREELGKVYKLYFEELLGEEAPSELVEARVESYMKTFDSN